MLPLATALGYLTGALLLVVAIGVYALPTIVAFVRKKRNRLNIAFFNIVLGWTVIAWAAMIVEAFKADDAP
jgi:predicted membrane channel-forming protein YqfA (hemolysin III family)